jgi:hypothetical protein
MGIDRVPAFPSKRDIENSVLDAYVFGSYKDRTTNLIPDYGRALELWQRLSASDRRFEVLWCSTDPSIPTPDSPSPRMAYDPLGFDVSAIGGDYWSVVDDISRSEWAVRFVSLLNQNGLFQARDDALAYLDEYVRNREPDWDSGLRVVFVARIRTEQPIRADEGPDC